MTKDSVGKSGSMLVFWSELVQVKIMESNDFSIEMQVTTLDGKESFCVIFVYASTDDKVRQVQWETLIKGTVYWGKRWVIGGDFNNIKANEENKGGRKRLESSFVGFKNFIDEMEMGDIKFKCESWT